MKNFTNSIARLFFLVAALFISYAGQAQACTTTVSVTSAQPGCYGGSVTLEAVNPDLVSPTYEWFVNGTMQGPDAPIYTDVFQDGDQVQVVTFDFNCIVTVSNTVIVSVYPQPSVTIAVTSPQPSCYGAMTTVEATSTNAGINPTYQWYVNGAPTSTSNPYTAALNDGDQVYVEMTDGLGCGIVTTSNTLTISVSPQPSVSISVTSSQPVCFGSNTTITATPTNAGTNPTYQWYVNGAPTSTSNPYTAALNDGDQVYVEMTDDLGCGILSTSNTVTISVYPDNSVTVADTVCAGGSFTFNGHVYNTTNTYLDTLAGVNCDSVITTNLVVLPPATSSQNAAICQGGTYTYNGHNYTTANTYTDTLPGAGTHGCDSIVTTTLTVNQPSATTQNDTVCAGGSVTVNGHVYNTTNTYLDTLAGVNCDSVITTNLVVLPPATSTQNAAICQGGTYTYNGHNYTTANTYTDTLPGAGTHGCDSIVTTTLTVNQPSATTQNDTVCAGGSFTYNGHVYNTTNTYLDTLAGVNCDSVITTNLVVLPPATSTQNAAICQGGTYTYNGHNYTTANTYTDTLPGAATHGCDSIVTTTLTVNQPSATTQNDTVCAGGSFTFNGHVYNTTNTYLDTLAGVNCDSVITTNLVVLPPATSTQNAAICQGGTYTYNGHNYTTANTYTDTLPGAGTHGCDSIVTTTLTVNQPSATTQNDTVCAGGSFTFNGHVYNATNTYLDTLAGVNCDSVITTNLVVLPPATSTQNAAICQGGTYTYNGHNYTTANTYTDTLAGAGTHGCDSIVTTTLTVNQPSATTQNDTVCAGGSFTYNGHVYNTTNTYLDTLAGVNCDSVITTNLVVLPPATSTQNAAICQGGTYTYNGHTYTTANTYTDTLPGAATHGCDSIVTTTLTVNQPSATTQNDTVCAGGSFTFNGHVYNTTNTYLDTLAGVNCDSVITTNLVVLPPASSTQNAAICQGGTYTYNGHNYTTANTYTDTLAGAGTHGCDSIVTTTLTVNQPSATTQNDTVCAGGSFTYNGHVYNTTNTYLDTLAGVNCDSVITTNLVVLPPATSTQNAAICQGGTYTYNGHNYTTANTYTDTLAGAGTHGCDSIVTTTLTVNQPSATTQNDTVCAGGSVTVNGHVYNTTNTYIDTLSGISCDSVVTTNLVVLSPDTFTQNPVICQGQTFTVNGHGYTAANTYLDTIPGAGVHGCDSLITTNLTVNQPTSSTQNDTVCAGDSVIVNGHVYNTTNTYMDTIATGNSVSCDSVIIINLVVLAPDTFTQNPVVCQGGSVTVNGHIYNTTNTYLDTIAGGGMNGCDSTITTHLVVIQPDTFTQRPVICQGQSVTAGSSTYNTAGTYTDTIPGAGVNSCDSIVITILTINPVPDVNPTPDQVLCSNTATTTVVFTGSVPGTDFNWTGSSPDINLASSGTDSIPSFTAINNSTAPIIDTLIVTPAYTSGGTTCTGTPDTFTITVNPTPTVVPTADQVVCNGDSTTAVTFTGAVAGTSYDWTGTNGTIGISQGGNGNIASFTTINTGTVAVIDTIIVVPSFTNAGVTCTGAPDTFTITVNPTPVLAPSADQGVCNGDTTRAISFSSTVAGTTYTWTGSNGSIGLATNGAGGVPSFTAINPGTSDVIDTIVVTPSSPDACVGMADTFTITVHPTPVVALGANVTQCGGSVRIDAGNPGSTFAWSDGATTQIDTVSSSSIYTVTVTTIYGCIDSGSKTVYIKPAPSVNLGPDASYCGGTVTLDAGNIGDTYLWSTGAATQQIVVSASDVYSVIVTDTASGCRGYDTIKITINNVPPVNLGSDTILCGGSITLVAGDPGNGYVWSSGSTSNTITVTQTGTYMVTVTYPSGCTALGSIHVSVYALPNLGPDVTDSICPGSRADLYTYYQGSGLTMSYSTPTPASVDQGRYVVVGTNSNGCTDTAIITILYRQKPDLGPDQADSICPGYIYDLRRLYPNTGYSSYTWVNNPNDSAVGAGTYQLIVTNASGCSDTASAVITLRQKPDLGGNKSDSICLHSTYDLRTLYPNTGYSSYVWNVANDSAVTAGTYQLVVINNSGCSDTATATITYRAQPVVTLASSPNLCSTVPAFQLTGGAPAGGTYFINNVAGALFDPSILGSGPQHIVYVYTNGSGCTDSAATTITIYPQPVIIDTIPLPIACTGSQAIDLDQYFSPVGGSYFGPAITGHYFYPSLAGVGTDSITYIYTDQHGCTDTAGSRITVSNQVHVVLHTNNANYTACGGDSVTFFAAGATGYQFLVNGTPVTSISGASSFTSTTLQNHDQVTVVGTNACSSDTSDFIIIDVNAPPVADAGTDTTIDLGHATVLRGSGTGTGTLTYGWSPFTNLNFPNVPNPTYAGPDTVHFVLRVTDANGCFDTASVTVNVRIPDNVILPNLITPNGDGQNDAWVLNPKINLAGSHLVIFNRWGEKVYEANSYANDWKGTYMTSGDKLPDGTYYYVLTVPAQDNHTYEGPINLLSTQK